MASIFQEDQSTARPPLFTCSNYAYQARRMGIFKDANGLEIWLET
jgi:hypothetical protein